MSDSPSILADLLLQGCRERAAGYDRDNRFCQEDVDELKAAGCRMALPKEFGGFGLTLAKAGRETRGWPITHPAQDSASTCISNGPGRRPISDDLWHAAKARQQQMRQTVTKAGNIGRAQRPLHLFSGLIRCGMCGSSYVVCSAHRLGCIGRRDRGICANELTIRRDEVEARVLSALQNRFSESGSFEVFCEEYTAAINEARIEHRGNL